MNVASCSGSDSMADHQQDDGDKRPVVEGDPGHKPGDRERARIQMAALYLHQVLPAKAMLERAVKINEIVLPEEEVARRGGLPRQLDSDQPDCGQSDAMLAHDPGGDLLPRDGVLVLPADRQGRPVRLNGHGALAPFTWSPGELPARGPAHTPRGVRAARVGEPNPGYSGVTRGMPVSVQAAQQPSSAAPALVLR